MPEVRPWSIDSSETVVSDRWIHLRADSCVDAAGRKIAPYYVLEPSDWVSVLALDANQDAILVEEYRHGAGIVGREQGCSMQLYTTLPH